MRQGNRNGFLNGKYLGLNFRADNCAEHEWGIKGINDFVLIPESFNGKSWWIVDTKIKAGKLHQKLLPDCECCKKK